MRRTWPNESGAADVRIVTNEGEKYTLRFSYRAARRYNLHNKRVAGAAGSSTR